MTKNKTIVEAEPGKQELFIVRDFDAPRSRVFEAFADPNFFARWNSHGHVKIDVWNHVTNGSYRFSIGGGTDANFGVFHEVLAPERIIQTFEYSGLPEKGHVALQKTLFEALSEKATRVTIHFICESIAYRDGLVGSGMGEFLAKAYESLEEILSEESR
jgi:uncharacterized protein YndB with AHSA1/START domain